MRRIGTRLHNLFGESVTVTFVSAGVLDVQTGLITRSTTTSVERVQVHRHSRHGGQLPRNQLRLTFAAAAVDELNIGDTVTIGSDVYEVVRADYLWSGEKRALYDVTVQR